jgi:HlyD family secretion protein
VDIPRQQNLLKRKILRFASAVVALAIVVGISVVISRLKPASPTVDRTTVIIDTVKRGSLLRQVRGYGRLAPEEMQLIPASTEGRIERIMVRPGAAVQPDTILLEMSNPELERDVATAEMDIKAAEADYASLKVRLEKEVLEQEADLATMEANHSQATLEAAMNDQLAKDGLISALQLQLSKNKAQELTTRRKIEQKRLEISGGAVQTQLAAQSARVDQYRAIARLKQSQLAALKVRAGTAGVLALLPVEVGQRVIPGTELARVANPHKLKAEIKIPETQAKDILLGQPASIDTHNGVIDGSVVRIDPAVVDGSVTVDIALTGELPKGARPDLSVDGTIELERMENILYVGRPSMAQEKSLAGMFRLVEQGKEASRVRVQVGRASVNAIEIVDGLAEGDQVIVSDMSSWDSTDQIRLN